MALFKRGSVWWMQFYIRGKRIQESTMRTNRRDAENYQAARRLAILNGEIGIVERKPTPRFDHAMQEFLGWSKLEHSAHPNTHKRYITSSKPLLRFFKGYVDEVGVQEVENYKQLRAGTKSKHTKRKLRPATVNRELACLRAQFSYFVRADVLVKNPVSKVKFLAEDNEQTRVLSFDEQKKYLAACGQPLRDVAVLMLETGMRPEEVYRLRVADVHLGEVPYIYNPYGKTKTATRKVPLTTVAASLLKVRLAMNTSAYVFPSPHDPNHPITKLNLTHIRAIKRAKVAYFRLYDLRHTFATRAVEAGVDLITLAALLGHSRIVMVQRYAHPGEEHKADAVRKLEGFCQRGRTVGEEVKPTEPHYNTTTASLAVATSPSKLVN